MSSIGQNVIKLDAADKASGKALYAADIRMPGMLYAAAARSHSAHGLLKDIDVSHALAYPGVRAVFTARDIPGINLSSPTGPKDQPVLNDGHVRFRGEAIAVVVAETLAIARAAASLVKADITPLDVLSCPQDAMKDDAPLIFETGNVMMQKLTVMGDYSAAEKEADLIIANTYSTHAVDHAYIEPDSCTAYLENGILVALTTTKSSHHDKEGICHFLGLKEEDVQVRAQQIGGSFGGKSDIQLVCMTSLAAYKTGSPVQMALTREEVLCTTTKRHPATISITHAVKKDGAIIGIKAELMLDAGAYGGYSGSVLTRSVGHATGPYFVPNVLVEGRAVHTNKPSSGAMRGYGIPQLSFAYEAQMDIIAEKLGLTPWEIRRKNAIRPGMASATGHVMSDGARYFEAIEKLESMTDRLHVTPSGSAWSKRGWGIAGCVYGNGRTGLPNPGVARCELNRDGTVTCYVGSPDIGQGSNTAFRQIAAEALRIPVSCVKCISADTRFTEDSGTTSGTRLTFVVGNGVRVAAEDLLQKLEPYLRDKHGNAEGQVTEYSQQLFARVAGQQTDGTFVGHGYYDPDTVPLDAEGRGKPYGAYTFGIQYADVSVNMFTGRVTVNRMLACYDSGIVINPILYEGQVNGGIAQGIGLALLEELGFDKENTVNNSNFDRYLLPTSLDVPEMEVDWAALADKAGPFGAKGIGEPGTIPTAAALANAVANATGIRFYSLPMNLENIQAAVCKGGDDHDR